MVRAVAFAFVLAFSAPSTEAQPLALTGATVYDGTGNTPLASATLVIEDGRIACIGPECGIPPEARVVDLNGRFVTPGLVDAHVHYGQTGWLDGRPDSRIGDYDYEALQASLEADPDRWHHAYLCSGVTAVYDPGGLPWTIGVGEEPSTERPHVVSAGPLLTPFEPIFGVIATADADTFLPMQTDAEALASVVQLAEWGADAVKVWFIDPPAGRRDEMVARLQQIGEEARARGLPLIVHATELRNAKEALRAGAAMLVHSVEDEPVDDEFVRLMGASGATYAPTLRVGRNWRRAVVSAALGIVPPIDDPNGCVDTETRRLIESAPALAETMPAARRNPSALFASLEGTGRDEAMMEANLLRLWRAGIPIATATDAGNPLTLHGPAIYAEMEAMESAGIPPEAVLVMSTRNGSAIMGRSDEIGTIEAGKLADLIVLAEDPGSSTSAFRSITHVMRAGVLREIGVFSSSD